jgi:hypothetical protein
VILGLIALFSSYDHITAFGRSIRPAAAMGHPPHRCLGGDSF